MIVLYIMAGCGFGWLVPELCVVLGQGKIRVPVGMNIISAFCGGVITYAHLTGGAA